jgi:RNA polymerase sigma-70 factor, ECF subfamily
MNKVTSFKGFLVARCRIE